MQKSEKSGVQIPANNIHSNNWQAMNGKGFEVQQEAEQKPAEEAKGGQPARPEYTGDKGLVNLTMERDTPIEKKPVAEFGYGQRIRIAKLHENHEAYMEHIIQVCGWARTTRTGGKDFFFIELYDGSGAQSLQIVVDSTMPNFADICTCNVGASFKIKGKLVPSPAKGQLFEMQVCQPDTHEVKVFGKCDNGVGKYPLAKKKHSLEFLREQAHLRPRTRLIAAMTRVRNNLAYATHKFFQERGFQYIHTPLITASDCEGAGEMFQVTTVLPPPEKPVVDALPLISYDGQLEAEVKAEAAKNDTKKKKNPQNAPKQKAKKAPANIPNPDATPEQLAALETAREAVVSMKKAKAEKADVEVAVAELKRLKDICEIPAPVVEEEAAVNEEQKAADEKSMIPMNQRKMNYKEDFFDKPAFLTVSGQLSVENYCCALGDVYTFGPTFRAENSNTTRHLAEFWMIEPEIAFADLDDNMNLAEDYLKYCLRYVLLNNADDIAYFTAEEKADKTKKEKFDVALQQRLEQVADTPFKRISYTECIAVLEEHMAAKKVKFLETPAWGKDMQSEHERYLAEKVFNMPIIVFNYPKEFKAFYMKQNEDGKTCQAMDILVPAIGELMGGSVREENLERLDRALKEKGLELDPYWWYRELRMYGTQPHAGFGLGFERLVMMCTGIENIRDVIPFPRCPGKAEF